MANKENSTPDIGKSADFGVMHNPQPSRARTHARVVRPTGILKESLTVLPGAHAREGVRTREGSATVPHMGNDLVREGVRTREGSAAADCRSAGGQSWRESVRTRDDANFSAWRVKTFGGNFDPVHEAVEDAVAAFSDRQASRDRSLWLKVANEIGFEAFRELYLEQCSIMRECKLRNPAAAFQNRLNRYTGHNSGKGGAA